MWRAVKGKGGRCPCGMLGALQGQARPPPPSSGLAGRPFALEEVRRSNPVTDLSPSPSNFRRPVGLGTAARRQAAAAAGSGFSWHEQQHGAAASGAATAGKGRQPQQPWAPPSGRGG